MERGASACPPRATAPLEAASPPLRHQPRTVLIVVNVLPLVFERSTTNSGWDVKWSSSSTSLFYRNLVSDSDRYQPLFLGCPEVYVARDEEAAVEQQLRAFNCVPVFLDPQVAHRYFQGFCKGVLWPVFHNVVDVYNSAKLSLDPFTESDRCANLQPQATTVNSSRHEVETQTPKAAWCDPASWNPAAQDVCWGDYCSVNRTFARRVIESYHDDYMIWIHDFHFLMLPSYLLRKLRVAITAMYLHVPFPSSEIFRCLAMRTEILRAMLCADHIGFLIFEHARHFLTSCKRLLGLNYKASPNGMLAVEYNGRTVCISCSHIEPDVRYLHSMIDRQQMNTGGDHVDEARQFSKRIERVIYDSESKKRKFVITSVDRLEGLSAIPLKLRAFDRFLALHPSMRGCVTLVQIGISLDSRPNDYHQTLNYVKQFVREINQRWSLGPAESDQVIYFEEKPIATCPERMLLWQMSDVFLDTCIRYGLSLLPFEYLVAQKRIAEQFSADNRDNRLGVMIVSEFASYSRILNGCLLVNPWKTEDIVTAFVKATEMQYYERLNRFQINYTFLSVHSEARWSERLLGDFEILGEKKRQVMGSKDTVEVGFGFDYRVLQFAIGFEKLDTDDVVQLSTSCSYRLFVFDYGGTLSWTTGIFEEGYIERRSERLNSTNNVFGGASLSRTAIVQKWEGIVRHLDGQVRTPLSRGGRETIQALCADHQNIVFVISTGAKAEIEAEFGSISNLNLVADNGLFVSKANQVGARTRNWECLCTQDKLTMQWKDSVRRIMQSFATRTNGSFMVEREASLLYDYRHSDPEYGEIQALELYEQLHQVLKEGEATIYRGKGFVEVHQFGVNKGVAVSLILHYLKEHVRVPELALYIGDDESDELAFTAIEKFAQENPSLAYVFSCTVGMKPSSARAYVDSVSDVLVLLHALASRSRREQPGTATSRLKNGYLDHFLQQSAPIVVSPLARALVEPASAVSTTIGTPSESSSLPRALRSVEWLALGVGVALGVAVAMSPAGRRLARQLQHLAGGS